MRLAVAVLAAMFAAVSCSSTATTVLLDDFESPISGGLEGTLDYGAGAGSSLEATADSQIKYSGAQSLKLDYDAVADGYMWAARGSGLDAANALWLIKPEQIDWKKYRSISFYMYGRDSKDKIAFDIKDAGNEMWRCMVEDNFQGWKKMDCAFEQFSARGDWQPNTADKNGVLDFPVKSFQFEPRPPAKGALYFDRVEVNP